MQLAGTSTWTKTRIGASSSSRQVTNVPLETPHRLKATATAPTLVGGPTMTARMGMAITGLMVGVAVVNLRRLPTQVTAMDIIVRMILKMR